MLVSCVDVLLGGGNVWKLCVENIGEWNVYVMFCPTYIYVFITSNVKNGITCTVSVEKPVNRQILSSWKTGEFN